MTEIPLILQLTGRAVCLRTHLKEDYPYLKSVLNDQETMSALHQYFGVIDWTDEMIQKRYEKFLEDQKHGKALSFTVIFKKNNNIVGSCGFKNIDQVEEKAEFGLILHRSVWGKGACADCHLLCLDYAFEKLKLQKIYFTTDNHNYRMQGFFKKVGISQVDKTSEGYLYYELLKLQ